MNKQNLNFVFVSFKQPNHLAATYICIISHITSFVNKNIFLKIKNSEALNLGEKQECLCRNILSFNYMYLKIPFTCFLLSYLTFDKIFNHIQQMFC